MPFLVTYDFSNQKHHFYSLHLDLSEMVKACESVDFSHLFGLIDPKDQSFVDKLKGARNLVILKSIGEQAETSLPAMKCILTDHLFAKESPCARKINVNLLIPDMKPAKFQTSWSLFLENVFFILFYI